MCVGNKPARNNNFLSLGSPLTHKFMYSVIVVNLKIMTAVNDKKAVIGALNKQAHSAVDKSLVVLKAVKYRRTFLLKRSPLKRREGSVFADRYTKRRIAGCKQSSHR